MNAITPHWIPVERIQPFLELEAWLLVAILGVGAWVFYRGLLKGISDRRHAAMRKRFAKLLVLLTIYTVLAAGHWNLYRLADQDVSARIAAYFALFALGFGAGVVIRLAHLGLYLYLFLVNMRVGVPRLIANMFTLVFGTLVLGTIAWHVFGVKIAPLLATSALFSVILGLALQDTLGNLFSGVGLQLDKPFGIGDWVEVQNGAQKWVGQIQEVTWRATLLVGFGDELISIPNRTMAQSQVLIFTHSQNPARRNQMFRFPLDVEVSLAKKVLIDALEGIPEILRQPEPTVLITETTESWIVMKVFYSLADYGVQYRVGDRVTTQVLQGLKRHGLRLASTRVTVVSAGSVSGGSGDSASAPAAGSSAGPTLQGALPEIFS